MMMMMMSIVDCVRIMHPSIVRVRFEFNADGEDIEIENISHYYSESQHIHIIEIHSQSSMCVCESIILNEALRAFFHSSSLVLLLLCQSTSLTAPMQP